MARIITLGDAGVGMKQKSQSFLFRTVRPGLTLEAMLDWKEDDSSTTGFENALRNPWEARCLTLARSKLLLCS